MEHPHWGGLGWAWWALAFVEQVVPVAFLVAEPTDELVLGDRNALVPEPPASPCTGISYYSFMSSSTPLFILFFYF